MKPLLKWSCLPLTDGWLMFAVDVDLAGPGEPECLLGLRQAVHPYYFGRGVEPVISFGAVIAEMDSQIRKGCGVSATPHSASRAHAFADENLYRAGRESIQPQAITVRNLRDLAETSQRMHKRRS